jgi:hypothetical protein
VIGTLLPSIADADARRSECGVNPAGIDAFRAALVNRS